MKKLVTSLKGKTVLFNIAMGCIIFFISLAVFRTYYLGYHEKNVKRATLNLLEYLDKNFDDVETALDWSERNLNMKVYEFAGVEGVIANLPLTVDAESILSLSEREQLEKGKYVVKDLKRTDFQINMLTFFYPVMKNGSLELLLVTYMPVNNPSHTTVGLPFFFVLLMTIAVVATFIIAKKSFGKSYNQLQEIKSAVTEVSNGNYDAKIGKNSSDELGEIADVFNQMSTALKTNRDRVIEIVNDISHELNTPLTYIKTYNQALMDGIIQEPQEQYKSYQLIDRETNRLQKLIQTSLDFTKLDANVVELEKQPIVFAQAIEEMMEKFEPIFEIHQVQFEMILDYDVIIEGDQDRLEQIVQNIVQNAIRYSKENPRIEMKLEKQGENCILSIADNGIGISEEHLSIITNRFVRVKKVRSRKESGTGIGLSIVEKLMTLHGGEIKIESELGVGTTFKLIFSCM